ncbi:hypothetical protein N8833_01090 [Salibacteraceae bacterium]|jgi:hypothetical protein|nr:hypothetical protein [Salibacteraceae bacterium]MDA9967964.1 hypothetical protein [Salibacteraceae bacterium]
MKLESGSAIAGGSILGMGVGFLFDNMLPFLLIGTGVGFFIEFYFKNKKEKNDEQ